MAQALMDDPLQLTNVKINSLGEISGTVKSTDPDKDGKTVSIGKVAIATFQNPEGLSKKGSFTMGQQKAITVVMLPLRSQEEAPLL